MRKWRKALLPEDRGGEPEEAIEPAIRVDGLDLKHAEAKLLRQLAEHEALFGLFGPPEVARRVRDIMVGIAAGGRYNRRAAPEPAKRPRRRKPKLTVVETPSAA
jgi:hypothetical protein